MAADHLSIDSDLTRRGVMRSAAVGGLALPLLAACGDGGESSGSGDPAPPGPPSGKEPVKVPTADVPVGGGTILTDDLIVVTQPTEGEFKAFTATCTHQGCAVGSIADGQIVCPCHNSHYAIEDGSVLSGPAPKPLASFPVSVEGDQVVVG